MILIFTDGSSLGNPGKGGWGAIVRSGTKVRELGGSDAHTTNNRMEMTAIIEALRFLGDEKDPITIYTDSKYTIDGITKWVQGWRKNGWKTKNKTEVLNRDLWENLVLATEGKTISWHHVAGHVGIPGNERVDTIAQGFSSTGKVPLFEGFEKDYSVSLTKLSATTTKKTKSDGGKAYSYLAFVDEKVHRFSTWKECETFVKGKHAKFRKAVSKEQEGEILQDWGLLS